QRLDRAQKLSLLDGEGADGKCDRRALGKQQQRLEQREGALAPRKRHCHAVAVANHLEAMDRLADLAQQCSFKLHKLIIVGITGFLWCLRHASWHLTPYEKSDAADMRRICWLQTPGRSIPAMPRWRRRSCSACCD